MADNSLIKIDGNLTEPFTRLVEKCCEGIGVLYEPRRLKKLAQAKAEIKAEAKMEAKAEAKMEAKMEANKIFAESDIEISETQRRGINRLIQEEGKKQDNIENLLLEASSHLKEDSKPEEIKNDWIANTIEKAKNVSDEEMRNLWAKLLAGEANKPGTFSKRTVNFVGGLDKSEADLFTNFCSFTICSGVIIPVIYDYNNNLLNSNGINFLALSHLDSIGLINFTDLTQFLNAGQDKSIFARYFDKPIIFNFNQDKGNNFIFGHAKFTKIGQELAPIANGKPIEGYLEYLIDHWKKLGYKATPITK